NIIQKMFNNLGFYYYCRDYYPNDPFTTDPDIKVSPKKILEESLNADIVLIVGTESNLYQYPYRYHLYLIDAVFSKASEDEIKQYYQSLIYQDPLWLEELSEEAALKNVPLKSYIDNRIAFYADEGYLDKPVLYRRKEIQKIKNEIRASRKWLAQVAEKANEKGISVEEQLFLDAEYIFNHRMKKKN
ncbi:MAG: hypothetical protein C0593_08885, partial [Marinilabiliales bacterium]